MTTIDIIWIFVLLVIVGILPAAVARGMGRSLLKWWIYSALLFPVAVAHIAYLRLTEGSRYCPYCHARVRYTAKNCTKCGYEFIEF